MKSDLCNVLSKVHGLQPQYTLQPPKRHVLSHTLHGYMLLLPGVPLLTHGPPSVALLLAHPHLSWQDPAALRVLRLKSGTRPRVGLPGSAIRLSDRMTRTGLEFEWIRRNLRSGGPTSYIVYFCLF